MNVPKPKSRGLLTKGQLEALKAFRDQTDGGVEQSYAVCHQESEKQRFDP